MSGNCVAEVVRAVPKCVARPAAKANRFALIRSFFAAASRLRRLWRPLRRKNFCGANFRFANLSMCAQARAYRMAMMRCELRDVAQRLLKVRDLSALLAHVQFCAMAVC
jgi:hypothetical protein